MMLSVTQQCLQENIVHWLQSGSVSLQKNLAKLVHKLHYLQVFTICIAVCVCQIYHSPYLKPNLQYAACFKPQSIFQSQNLYEFFLNMLELDP